MHEVAAPRPTLTAEIKPVAIHAAAPTTSSVPSANTSLGDGDIWPRVMQVANERAFDRQCVEHLVFQSFDGVTLRLTLDDGGADLAKFVGGQVERITDIVRRATGRSVKVELDLGGVAAKSTPAASANGPLPELVQKAVELFGATIVAVD